MTNAVSDEMLMRYADGELTGDAAEAIRAAIETDEGAAARLALFIQTRRAAQDALRPLLDEGVPSALKTRVERMVAEHAEPARRKALDRQWPMPMAASIALIFAGVVGYLVGSNRAPEMVLEAANLGGPAVAAFLTEAMSGEESEPKNAAPRMRIIASFRDEDETLCREFEVDHADGSTVVSVACFDNDGWNLRFAVVAPIQQQTGYAPASSTDALEAYLAAINAGGALTAADEAQALREVRLERP